MKELDEMEKVNAKLSVAVEEVTLEHCKKNEVTTPSLHLKLPVPLSFLGCLELRVPFPFRDMINAPDLTSK